MGAFADRLCISDIKERNLGYGQKPDYITVKGHISYTKHDSGVWYQACPKCQKKVIQDVNQNYLCEKCQMTHEQCENRYILSFTIQDQSGTTWATAFNDAGKIMLQGKSADELAELQMTNKQAYDQVFRDVTYEEFVFKLRVKAEQVLEETRVKASVMNVEAMDFVKESSELLTAISKYTY